MKKQWERRIGSLPKHKRPLNAIRIVFALYCKKVSLPNTLPTLTNVRDKHEGLHLYENNLKLPLLQLISNSEYRQMLLIFFRRKHNGCVKKYNPNKGPTLGLHVLPLLLFSKMSYSERLKCFVEFSLSTTTENLSHIRARTLRFYS